ncbi:hypothetical protein L208DRAFT_1433390 [Tricholoma matsutake]|nr:hypothetical protein L208DRAFT_1433390 [Tricholoma matsutake 945]
MRTAHENVKQALLKLEACPIDDQIKKILWDRYQETTERYQLLYGTQGDSKTPANDDASPEDDSNTTDTPDTKIHFDVDTEQAGFVVWTISTPPEDPVPVALSFKMEAPVEEKDIPTVMMMAGDEIVGTAVEKAREPQYEEVLKDAEIRGYFAESFDRLDLQRRKMDSYASNDVALDVACRLYFSDAFGFLRRVMLILVNHLLSFCNGC